MNMKQHRNRNLLALCSLLSLVGALTACGGGESEVLAPPPGSNNGNIIPSTVKEIGNTPNRKPGHQASPSHAHDGKNRLTQVPNPIAPTTSTPIDANVEVHKCGVAPDEKGNTLEVYAFGQTACEKVMPIAQQFGRHTNDKNSTTYNGWVCGASSIQGYIGECVTSGEKFALKRAHS